MDLLFFIIFFFHSLFPPLPSFRSFGSSFAVSFSCPLCFCCTSSFVGGLLAFIWFSPIVLAFSFRSFSPSPALIVSRQISS